MKRTFSNFLVIVGVMVMVAVFFIPRAFPELLEFQAPAWQVYLPAWMEGVGGMLLMAGLSFKLGQSQDRDGDHGFMMKLSRSDVGVSDDAYPKRMPLSQR